ncbi:MAG: hypothetical protein LBN96_06890 [Desulfovibrio sp.]|jgi:hypothetical protein|nr:hypothetical protein [Desulfovibrio sp.]
MRTALLCFFCILPWLVHSPVLAADPVADDRGWTIMPAGARPAYMGIHGGTMPVSLLVVADGSSLLGFVGRTGNDFLDVLRSTKVSFFSGLPFNGNADKESAVNSGEAAKYRENIAGISDRGTSGGINSVFVTGNGLTSLPVIQIGSGLAALPFTTEQLLPFGFSDKPLSIEGDVAPPAKSAPVHRYRLVFEPQYLQPRKAR